MKGSHHKKKLPQEIPTQPEKGMRVYGAFPKDRDFIQNTLFLNQPWVRMDQIKVRSNGMKWNEIRSTWSSMVGKNCWQLVPHGLVANWLFIHQLSYAHLVKIKPKKKQ